jgi:two-component system, OmpR family, response regulator
MYLQTSECAKGRDMLTGRKQSILIVDADRATRDLVKACIEGTEFTYWEAPGRKEALEFAKRVQDIALDFLVVDALLPPFNGADLARKIFSYRPALKTLFLTGHGRTEGVEDSLPGLPCDSLPKPVRKEELLEKLRGLLPSGQEAMSLGLSMGMGS